MKLYTQEEAQEMEPRKFNSTASNNIISMIRSSPKFSQKQDESFNEVFKEVFGTKCILAHLVFRCSFCLLFVAVLGIFLISDNKRSIYFGENRQKENRRRRNSDPQQQRADSSMKDIRKSWIDFQVKYFALITVAYKMERRNRDEAL